MFIRLALAAAALLSTSACYPVFDYSTPEKLTFDAMPPSQAPVTYADMMCCFECAV